MMANATYRFSGIKVAKVQYSIAVNGLVATLDSYRTVNTYGIKPPWNVALTD